MKQKAVELRKEADVEAEQERYEGAIKKYMLSIETCPEYYVAYTSLAKKVFLEQNNPDKAIEHCQKALDITKQDYPYAQRIKGDAHKLKVAILLSKKKDLAEIIKHYEQAESCYKVILPQEQHIAEKRLQDLHALKPLIDNSVSKDGSFNKSTADNSEDEADEDPFDAKGNLDSAMKEANIKLVKQLIKSGADVNIKDEYNLTPLHKATSYNYTAIVKLLLLEGKANPNTPGSAGLTALHIAAENGNKEILELLKNQGGKIDALNDNNSSLMHSAVIGIKEGKNNWGIVEWLIKNNADPFIENSRHQTPRDILENYDYSYAEKYDDILDAMGCYTDTSNDI